MDTRIQFFEESFEPLKYKGLLVRVFVKSFKNFRTTKDRALRFDFRIPMIGAPLIIEFDGSQHFSPQKFGAKITDEQAKTKFEKQLRYDKEKNEFCEELIKEFLESYTWTTTKKK